jgi:hypothetical protein
MPCQLTALQALHRNHVQVDICHFLSAIGTNTIADFRPLHTDTMLLLLLLLLVSFQTVSRELDRHSCCSTKLFGNTTQCAVQCHVCQQVDS